VSAASGVIGVVDFGAGNTRSVVRALRALGRNAVLQRTPEDLKGAERLVLPGVGAAGSAMATLHAQGLVEPLRAWVRAGRPFLGICLGAQLLLDSCEEDSTPGLGLLAGTCRRFPRPEDGGPRLVPHVGWNGVDLASGRAFEAYFVHGYWLDPADPATVAGTTEVDGFRFPSLLRSGNVLATQFHPEKSGPTGRALLGAWLAGLLDRAGGAVADGPASRASERVGAAAWS
jgi:imidazole glycerol phosphate synthase glutamine amidotransferase subunit